VSAERRAPEGIICALVHPLNADGSPDLAACNEIVDAVLEAGVHGLFALGTTGEGPLLDPRERMALAESIVAHVGGRRPVVVHCGTADTRTAAALATHAQTLGAAAAASIVPYYFKYGDTELERHFRTIAEAAPDVGHYVYENPDRTGYSAGVALVTRLVNDITNIHGVKDTGDSVGRITQYLAGPGIRPEVYTGNNLTIFASLALGARGAVSALANVAPRLVVSIYESLASGSGTEARRLQFVLAQLASATAGLPYIGALKYLLSRRGLPAGEPRAPQRSLTPAEVDILERRLAAESEVREWLDGGSTRSGPTPGHDSPVQP
jgi:dihydrodipicolinate synthase/N-acetylneuraminate lyase